MELQRENPQQLVQRAKRLKLKKLRQAAPVVEFSLDLGNDVTNTIDLGFETKAPAAMHNDADDGEAIEVTGDVAEEELAPDLMLEDIGSAGPVNRMTEVMRNIEAIYAHELDYMDGYDLSDSFLDSEDEIRDSEPTVRTRHSGFFINAGPIEVVEQLDEDMENEEEEEEGPARKRRRVADAAEEEVDPDVESAIIALQNAYRVAYSEGQAPKRFPAELEPFLEEVAHQAQLMQTQRFFTGPLVRRVASFMPFKEATVRGKLKAARVRREHAEATSQLQQERNAAYNSLAQRVEQRISLVALPPPPPPIAPQDGTEGAAVAVATPRWRWDPETIRALMSLRKVTRRLAKERNQIAPASEHLEEKDLKRLIRSDLSALWTKLATLWPDAWGMNAHKIGQKVSSVRKEEKKKKRAEEERRTRMAAEATSGPPRTVVELSSDDDERDGDRGEPRSGVTLPRSASISAAALVDEHSQSESQSQSQSLSSRPRGPSLLMRRPSLPPPLSTNLPTPVFGSPLALASSAPISRLTLPPPPPLTSFRKD